MDEMDEMDDSLGAPTTSGPAPPAVGSPGPAPGGRFRRNVLAVGAAVGLTLGGLGVAAAQTQGSTDPTAAPAAAPRPPGPGHPGKGAGLAAAAKALGMSEADLRTALHSGQSMAQVAESKKVDVKVVIDAMVAEAKARLAEDVTAGRLTQAQADERSATLEQRITEMVNRVGGAGPGHGGHGPGGPGGPGDHGPRPHLAAAAKAIGVSEADLETALRSGQSLAQVAQSKGVDVKVVVDALVAEARAKMAEQAATLEQRITEMVNRAGGAGPGGPRHP